MALAPVPVGPELRLELRRTTVSGSFSIAWPVLRKISLHLLNVQLWMPAPGAAHSHRPAGTIVAAEPCRGAGPRVPVTKLGYLSPILVRLQLAYCQVSTREGRRPTGHPQLQHRNPRVRRAGGCADRSLLLRRASESRPPAVGPDDYDVIGRGGEILGRVLRARISPPDTPWMWSLVDGEQTLATGYATSRATNVQLQGVVAGVTSDSRMCPTTSPDATTS